eukprot:CAMPEP_0197519178 /NCGR_PEP_ID=MMETSP1318-20131121/4448_1 /TAXON_ID=552666 /ORGANISM="Partenskyella glossopodia, Strain RCC365" /LENGTH=480 /DNA_ID=CAMNT_0043070013 /DNA_START=300 /DNA_END=1741 /DNA_ORIENTATION=+
MGFTSGPKPARFGSKADVKRPQTSARSFTHGLIPRNKDYANIISRAAVLSPTTSAATSTFLFQSSSISKRRSALEASKSFRKNSSRCILKEFKKCAPTTPECFSSLKRAENGSQTHAISGKTAAFFTAPTDPSKKGGLCAKSINGKCYYTGNCCSFQHLPEGIHSLEEYERASEGCKTFPELMRKLGRKKTQKSSLMSLMAGKVGLSEEDSRMLSNDSFKSMRTATGATGSVSGNRSPASSAAPGPAQDDWLSSALMSKVKIINDSPLLSLGSPALKTGSYLDSIKSSGSGSSMVAAISKKENNMNASSPSLSGMKPRSLLPFLSRNVGTNSLETDTNSASSTLSTAGSESDTEKEHDSATSSGRCVKRFASMVGNKGAKASCDNIKADRDESESEEMRQLREKAMATWNSEDVHTFVKSMGESEVWQACAQQMLESSIDGSILRDYASVELLAEDAEDYGLKNKAFVRKLSKAIQRWGA